MTADRLRDVLADFCARSGSAPASYDVQVGRNWRGKLCAIVTWSGFDEMVITQRQNQIWRFLREELSDEERQSVGLVFTKGMREELCAQEAASLGKQDLPWLE
jgi:hypothetical protein